MDKALHPKIGPPLPQGTTIASAAYRPRYFGRSELEHSAARKWNQLSPGIAGRSESLRNKRVRVVYGFSPAGNDWRCNAFPPA
jgi:hypothetical protein